MFYPEYSQSGAIARNDDLQKIVDDEELGDAAELLLEYECNGSVVEAQRLLDESNLEIYERTLQSLIDSIQEVKKL